MFRSLGQLRGCVGIGSLLSKDPKLWQSPPPKRNETIFGRLISSAICTFRGVSSSSSSNATSIAIRQGHGTTATDGTRTARSVTEMNKNSRRARKASIGMIAVALDPSVSIMDHEAITNRCLCAPELTVKSNHQGCLTGAWTTSPPGQARMRALRVREYLIM